PTRHQLSSIHHGERLAIGTAPVCPRHPRREAASLAEHAAHGDVAAEESDVPPRHVQAEPRAADAPRRGLIHLPERVEHAREMFGRDADPRVLDLEHENFTHLLGPRTYLYLAAVGELHRVADQVHE